MWPLLQLLALAGAFDRTVPAPYMDEPFHLLQTQAYCQGRFDEWDEKITTFPGLYLCGVLVAWAYAGLRGLASGDDFHAALALDPFYETARRNRDAALEALAEPVPLAPVAEHQPLVFGGGRGRAPSDDSSPFPHTFGKAAPL